MKLKLFLVAIAFHALGSAQEKKYLAQVRLNDKYGYINTSGKEVVPVVLTTAVLGGIISFRSISENQILRSSSRPCRN